MNIQKKEKGFTIIEVVLVLAIAGLIFLMVFIALPALQRGQRDTQRKNDLSRAMTSVTNYTSNNRGSLPTFNDSFITTYLATNGSTFVDPSGAPSSGAGASANNPATYVFATYPVAGLSGSYSNAVQNVIYVASSSTCGTGGAVTAAGSRNVALLTYLEGGGVACQNN